MEAGLEGKWRRDGGEIGGEMEAGLKAGCQEAWRDAALLRRLRPENRQHFSRLKRRIGAFRRPGKQQLKPRSKARLQTDKNTLPCGKETVPCTFTLCIELHTC